MILQDFRLRDWANHGGVAPFDNRCVNPASIDLRLGSQWRDIERPNELIVQDSIVLHPRSIYTDMYNKLANLLGLRRRSTAILATTLEYVKLPDDMAGSIKLKTTPSRRGLGHPIADWVDPGFVGQLTLMLHAHKPIVLKYRMRVVQLVVFQLSAPVAIPYHLTGHYFNQAGPTVAWESPD